MLAMRRAPAPPAAGDYQNGAASGASSRGGSRRAARPRLDRDLECVDVTRPQAHQMTDPVRGEGAAVDVAADRALVHREPLGGLVDGDQSLHANHVFIRVCIHVHQYTKCFGVVPLREPKALQSAGASLLAD